MEITSITNLLDGGTSIIIFDNKFTIYIDRRIGTDTINSLYSDYPSKTTAKCLNYLKRYVYKAAERYLEQNPDSVSAKRLIEDLQSTAM